MFENLKVLEVEFNEVDEIAGGSFLETFARNNQNEMNIKEVDGKYYIIRGGKSKVVDGGTIVEFVKKAMVGKNVKEIEANFKLQLLVKELRLIKKITLESTEENIELF